MEIIKRLIVSLHLLTFGLTTVMPAALAFEMPWMPQPGTMVTFTPAYTPVHLRGMVIHPNDPFKFDFLVFRGDQQLTNNQKQVEYSKLIKYFLASLAIPDEDQWVNLSPYEKNRIIPDNYGLTEMGRDVLAQDYMLKQISSSLTNPDIEFGNRFWDAVYEKSYQKFGTTDIPTDTFNKVWIVPDKAVIFEKGNTVIVLEHHLKVMLESDYKAMKEHEVGTGTVVDNEAVRIYKDVMREVVIPAIEREVNEGKNFAPLRQIHNSMLLAAWYKRALKESILNRVYSDSGKVKGIDQDPKNNRLIYDQYVASFRQGAFNRIREDVDRFSNEVIPRKYFSGGDHSMGYALDHDQLILERASDSAESQNAAVKVIGFADVVSIVLTQASGWMSRLAVSYKSLALGLFQRTNPADLPVEWRKGMKELLDRYGESVLQRVIQARDAARFGDGALMMSVFLTNKRSGVLMDQLKRIYSFQTKNAEISAATLRIRNILSDQTAYHVWRDSVDKDDDNHIMTSLILDMIVSMRGLNLIDDDVMTHLIFRAIGFSGYNPNADSLLNSDMMVSHYMLFDFGSPDVEDAVQIVFSLAHELGHGVMYSYNLRSTFRDDRYGVNEALPDLFAMAYVELMNGFKNIPGIVNDRYIFSGYHGVERLFKYLRGGPYLSYFMAAMERLATWEREQRDAPATEDFIRDLVVSVDEQSLMDVAELYNGRSIEYSYIFGDWLAIELPHGLQHIVSGTTATDRTARVLKHGQYLREMTPDEVAAFRRAVARQIEANPANNRLGYLYRLFFDGEAGALKGGIDFTLSNLDMQIKRDGAGVPLPINQQNFDNLQIDGLVPVILDIKSSANGPVLM